MADKKFSEFPVVTSPVLADITVVGLDALGQNAQFAGSEFSGGVSAHPSLTDRDLADQHPIGAITDLQTTLDGLQTDVDGKEPALGDPASDGYVLSSTALGVRSWVPPTEVGGVTSVIGLTGDITQPELRPALGLYDPTQAVDTGSGDDSIIVMVCAGNSQIGGWLAGDFPTALTTNTNVYIWQASTYNTTTATWQNADHSGATLDPLTYQMLGYCGGNVASSWLMAANRIQQQTGKKVFCIVSYQGGASSVLFDPVRGDTNNEYDFSGTYTNNNNMWYWTSAATNAALAALRAGTSGAPAAYPNKDFVDIVFADIGGGDALWAANVPVYYPTPAWTLDQANTQYVEAMQNFIDGAEGNSASTIGGWAKPWYTRWFINDVPAGSTSTAGTVSIATVFSGFTGNYTLVNNARSLVWGISCPSGAQTASDTVLGTVDNIHWNSFTQAHFGTSVGDAYLNQPLQRSRIFTDSGAAWNNEFTANVDGNGYNLSSVGDITLSGSLLSSVANGPTAIGFTLNTNNTLSTSGAKLLSLQNNATEKMWVDKDGNMQIDGELTTANFTSNYGGTGNALIGGGVDLGTGLLGSAVADGAGVIAFVMNSIPTLAGAGAKLLSITNNTVEKVFFDKDGNLQLDGEINTATFSSNYLGTGAALFSGSVGSGTGFFGSGIVDGTGVVAFTLNASNTIAGSGAKLLSLRNNTVEKLSVDKGGSLTIPSGDITLTSGDLVMTSGQIVGRDTSGAGYVEVQPLPSSTSAYFEFATVYGTGTITWKETSAGALGLGGCFQLRTSKADNTNTAFILSCLTAQTTNTTLLLDASVGGTSKFKLNVLGAPGFWGKTPITTQSTAGIGSSGTFTKNASANEAYKESTYTGGNGTTAYTVNDVVRALKDIGVLVL